MVLAIGVDGRDAAINRKGWVDVGIVQLQVVQGWIRGILMGAREGRGSMVRGGVLWSRGSRREEEFCVRFSLGHSGGGSQAGKRHAVCGRGGTVSVEKR